MSKQIYAYKTDGGEMVNNRYNTPHKCSVSASLRYQNPLDG